MYIFSSQSAYGPQSARLCKVQGLDLQPRLLKTSATSIVPSKLIETCPGIKSDDCHGVPWIFASKSLWLDSVCAPAPLSNFAGTEKVSNLTTPSAHGPERCSCWLDISYPSYTHLRDRGIVLLATDYGPFSQLGVSAEWLDGYSRCTDSRQHGQRLRCT